MTNLNVPSQAIFCHENLDVLQGINSNSIDLIYLDPPFNKKKIFTAPVGSSAEGAEFSDIFREEDIKNEWVDSIKFETPELYEYLNGVKSFSSKYNYCYLVYMAIRLIECYRVLKDTGSIYLHCDPTMSHYLKLMLDCVFGEKYFRNEIIWCYTGPGSPAMKQFNRKHDVIFYYSKGSTWTFNKDDVRIPHKDGGPHTGGYGIDSVSSAEYGKLGKVPETWWQMAIAPRSKSEYTGYPTQKPLKLLERIIQASSNEGDIVLDPFCGCATTCVAAQKLGRKWIGIDVSHKAYELVKTRLEKEVPNSLQFIEFDIIYSTDPPKRTDNGMGNQEKGFVYVISNSNWSGIYKVGIAKDVNRRLNSYQTSDPYRAYELKYSLLTPYFREIEKQVHKSYKHRGDHEWVEGELNDIIDTIKKAAQKSQNAE